jgi:hypothetical protein
MQRSADAISSGFTVQDYLSLVSNDIEEYTLILCVTPPESVLKTKPNGGLTVIQPKAALIHQSTATTTPDAALLFRKDLTHSSTPLLAGDKQILTLVSP